MLSAPYFNAEHQTKKIPYHMPVSIIHPFPDYNPKYQNTPWIDLAMLTSNTSDCDLVKSASFNQNSKWECVLGDDSTRKYGRAINKPDCEVCKKIHF